MKLSAKIYNVWIHRKRRQLSATKVIALTFFSIILLGSILLTLPVASRSGQPCSFLDALFTATSATCVTGLVMFDTWTQWSGFGQAVILCMIQLGGLGFMSAAALVIFLLRKRVGLKQRMVMAQALSLTDMESVVKLQKLVLTGSFTIEGIGALILMLRFWPVYGLRKAVIMGIFHAVSAFCNAGFDILGFITPDASLLEVNSDPVVLLTLGMLVILGGLGFFVWEEVTRLRSFRKCSVYTKLVLLTSGALLLAGTVGFLLLEWNNPATLGNMSVGDKLLNAWFQSVTTRTAGFDALGQGGLTDGSKGLAIVLMMIGGSSGSTAGGIKTVSFVVILLFLWARARGRSEVTVFRRSVPAGQVMDAMTIAGIMILLALVGTVVICATSPVGFVDAMYEASSALATVGLTAGATRQLSLVAKLLIIVFMYFGRVGILTISLGFLMGDKAESRFRYANTNLLIG